MFVIRKAGKPGDHILWQEAIGFSVLIVLCWTIEFLRIPHLIFGESREFNWTRVLFRTFVLLVVWTWMHLTTRRLLKRLHYLEEFLLVCSWCRKIGHQGRWLTMEQFFGSRFETETSHGICPICSHKQIEEFASDREAAKASHSRTEV